MSVRTQLAYLAAILTVARGLLGLLNPLLAAELVGVAVAAPRGLSEVRAVYGAMFLVLGGVMLWAVPTRPRSNAWLRLAGLLWLAVALGRVLSILLDSVITPLNFGLLALESLVAVGALLGGFQRPPLRPTSVRAEDDVPDPLKAYRG